MTSIGAIFSSTCHTKQLAKLISQLLYVVNHSQLRACLPNEDGLLEGHLSTCGCEINPGLLCSIFTYYAFEQCSKNLPYIMLNIMPMTTAIMPQFVYDFMTRLALLGSR